MNKKKYCSCCKNILKGKDYFEHKKNKKRKICPSCWEKEMNFSINKSFNNHFEK